MANKNRTAASVATRLATVLTHDNTFYNSQWELVSVAPVSLFDGRHAGGERGHQVIMRDTAEEAEYVITVYRRFTVPAIPASIDRDMAEAEAEADDASQEVPF